MIIDIENVAKSHIQKRLVFQVKIVCMIGYRLKNKALLTGF
jgi:hypothetical protein